MGDWISVEKREPSLGWNCLVWYAGGFPAVIRITNRSLNERDFTHWIKIPDAPEDA